MKIWSNIYQELITFDTIYLSFKEFKKDKKKTFELLTFERRLEDNLFSIYEKFKNKTYMPGNYTGFYINDPKVRLIHKATLEDRIIHHIVSRGLEKIFEPIFIFNSYSCRNKKGTHKGVSDLIKFTRAVSQNNTRDCFALKCDIRKFFASINQSVLLEILKKRIADPDYLLILERIIKSFNCGKENKGLPIGNLTSQYFANIYMNELDQYIKHKLKVKYYLRYTDDFIILSENKYYLQNLLGPIQQFLLVKLDLELHPQKIKFLNLRSGIDFLGYIVFPRHVLPRYKTKKRIFRKFKEKIVAFNQGQISYEILNQTLQSHLGYLSHCNGYKLSKELETMVQKTPRS